MLVAIDPGFNGTGLAAFTNEGELVGVSLVIPPAAGVVEFAERLRHAVRGMPDIKGADVIMEFPDRDDRKGDIVDLFKLGAITGAISVAPSFVTSRISYVFPSEWKQNVPKDIHHRRILATLSEKEVAVLDRRRHTLDESAFHNVLDAVGLGKWRIQHRTYLSRFDNPSKAMMRKKIRALRSPKSATPRSRKR